MLFDLQTLVELLRSPASIWSIAELRAALRDFGFEEWPSILPATGWIQLTATTGLLGRVHLSGDVPDEFEFLFPVPDVPDPPSEFAAVYLEFLAMTLGAGLGPPIDVQRPAEAATPADAPRPAETSTVRAFSWQEPAANVRLELRAATARTADLVALVVTRRSDDTAR